MDFRSLILNLLGALGDLAFQKFPSKAPVNSGLSPGREWVMGFRVKVIRALWLAMLVPALGAPGDPGETAMRFLEKTRDRQLNLEPGGDTALAPQTSPAKRREIARRLERLADDLGSDPLEAGPVKLDGEMAGVLIRKDDGFDPASLRVFSIALVKRGDIWVAAPVPSSFENTGLGYSVDLRQRAAALQDWMLRQQVLDLASLRDQAAERLRQNIEKSLPTEILRKLDSKQAAARFIDACARRNLPEILGLLGGLSANPPDDWPARLKSATAAVRAAEPKRPWRLLISNNLLRVPVHHEENAGQALVSVACLDPVSSGNRPVTPRIALVHLEISKSADGLWRVDPPARFFQEPSENDEPQDDSLDNDLLAAFPEKLAGVYPPAPERTARQASEKLLERLRDGDFPSLVSLIQPGGNSAEPCIRAARTWWAMHEPGGIRRLIPLGFKEDARTAAAVCQLFSTRSPDRQDLRIFHFEKSSDGWLWTPQPLPESEEALRDWANAESSDWQVRLLADCVELENLPDSGAPSEAEARAVIDSWLKATADGDVSAALRLTARLNTPKSETNVLRNLGYEMTGIRKTDEPPAITGVQRGGIWTAVGVRGATEDKPAHPLYPVVITPAGPRILIEIDLIASQNRTRDFLNRTALDRLRDLPKAAAELKELFQKHQAGITEAASP